MASSNSAAEDVDSQLDFNDEDGGPITDIIEQLDDDDNVISYRLISAGDSVDRVRAALEKAGVSESAETKPKIEEPKTIPEGEHTKPDEPAQKVESAEKDAAPRVKKSVSFSDDVPTEVESTNPEISFRAKRVEQIMNTAKEQEKISQDTPILPEDEDSDDAALRQDMLRYSMGEIGAVVAELQLLEEGDSEDSGFDDLDEGFDEDFEDDDEEDPEDEYGRNGRVVTNGYRKRMLELEKKLGIQSRSTQAERPAGDDQEDSDDEGIGRITVNRQAGASSTTKERTPLKSNIAENAKSEGEGKKNVRFASTLDIAPEQEVAAPAATKEKKDKVEPLSDIVERSPSSNPSPRQPATKPSRFKQARGETAPATAIPKGPVDIPAHFADQDRPTAPSGPAGTTIAETLVERQPSTKAVAPDEFDGSIAYQEVADEYQKMRRRFIQREGGFLKEDESPVQPVVDEDSQERISRFKAARLSRQ